MDEPAKSTSNDRIQASSRPTSTEVLHLTAMQAEHFHRTTAHGAMPSASLGTVVVSVATTVILWPRVPHGLLCAWLAFKLLVVLGRVIHMRHYARHGGPVAPFVSAYRWGVLLDGLAWSALGWGLTPPSNLEIAVVTIGVQLSVVALGGAMMYNDLLAGRVFLLIILVPNAFYALQRGDDLGVFCCVAYLFAVIMFMGEAKRTNRRISELQQLREQADETVQAQAQALQEAQSLSQMKSRFVATMSHEMRTPVHGILGLLRVARPLVHDPEALRQLDLIRKVSDHLAGVINHVLDFSKMEAHALPIHEQPFDLRALIQEVADTWSLHCQDKGLSLQLKMRLANRLTTVQGDPQRIRQVLYNLIGNAVKFTDQGRITLRVSCDGQTPMVDFSVQDTGIGIPPSEINKIFHPFEQAEGTYQRQFGGTGLGLTISRQLCVAMGGDLVCQSKVNDGSVFSFSLPLPPAQTLAPIAPATHQPSDDSVILHTDGRAPHVLLVEDNDVNVIIAEAELKRLGVRVTTCHDGLKALVWLADNQPDLVLMDCDLPGMDGMEATRRIREQERLTGRDPIAIVALTAHGPEVYAANRLKAGMDDHLAKPFTTQALRTVLMRHLRKTASAMA